MRMVWWRWCMSNRVNRSSRMRSRSSSRRGGAAGGAAGPGGAAVVKRCCTAEPNCPNALAALSTNMLQFDGAIDRNRASSCEFLKKDELATHQHAREVIPAYSRRRDCHFAAPPSPVGGAFGMKRECLQNDKTSEHPSSSPLKHLLKGEGGAAE